MLMLALATASKVRSEEPTIVYNDGAVVRAANDSKKFDFKEDISIGAQDGEDFELFHRVYDIAVDSAGHIYVLDNGLARVQVYDKAGRHLQTVGRRGEGPGEFYFPTAIALDDVGRLYVADQSRITVFDKKGEYVDDMRHEIPDAFVQSIRVDTAFGIYLSCFHFFSQQIIHKFSLTLDLDQSSLVASFCDSYAAGKNVDVRLEQSLAGGTIDIDDTGVIYYSQMIPYEIRKFAPSGDLLMVIYRENDFVREPVVTKRKNGGMTIGPFTGSYGIIVLPEKKFMNLAKAQPLPNKPMENVIDLFDRSGKLLITQSVKEDIDIHCVDDLGRLYVVAKDPYQRIVRYEMSMK